ncbi:protein AATF-like isoform X2 [Montipora capricornis]|uniref:protein AATF-like isoform X2 n=1 Tax=Montipora capricornis TaxID=246305 RepID=UPI0035F13717
MASLADQIRSLTNPEPSRFDLDEDEFDVTRAQVVDKEKDLEDIKNESIPNAGALRKKTIRLLQDEDKKYAGRKITRAQLQSSRDNAVGTNNEEESNTNSDFEDDVQNGKEVSRGDGDDDIDDDNDDEDNDLGNDFSDEEDSIGSEDIQGNGVHDLSTESSEDDANYDDDDDDDENINDIDDDDVVENDEGADDNGIQSFSAASLAEDIEKGKAAKNQLSLWDSFLEMRIRLQKALIVANKLPQPQQMTEFSTCGDKNLKEVYKQGRKSVAKLLGNLLLIQESLLEQNADTSNILNPGTDNKTTSRSSDDEEIPSDTEDETSDGGVDNGEGHVNKEQFKHSLKLPAKRKHDMSTDEYAEYISKRHAAFKTYRDATIAKWSEKTRLATGKINSKSFSSFDRSALAQINHILSDKDRLIKRTQMKRSSYRVLGKSEEDEKQKVLSSEEQADMHLRDFDPEIFDDDDFYHQLLREFIEQKTSGTTGQPIELGRQWLELQKLRKKVKRKIDTKASKGRKVRPWETCQLYGTNRKRTYASLLKKRIIFLPVWSQATGASS